MTNTAKSEVEGCDIKVRESFSTFFAKGSNSQGKEELARVFHLCEKSMKELVNDESNQVRDRLAFFIVNAWDNMAMGNCICLRI